jgi:ABC-type sugar transport systems, ATPase components
VGKSIVLGIRPEDIEDAAIVGEDPQYQIVEADVDVTEPMGAEVYVYFSSGENSFIARLDASTSARDGAKHKVGFNMMKIHLFDKDTEEVIR